MDDVHKLLVIRVSSSLNQQLWTTTKKIIEKEGHTILWLPPYSPDLNPIEKMWAWVKHQWQLKEIKSIDKLFKYCMEFI